METPPSKSRHFGPATDAWNRNRGLVRDVVRQELVHRQLVAHLPEPADHNAIRVLDVGCGQGTQAIRLARAGCIVVGIDPSTELRSVARQSLACENSEVQQRVELRHGTIDEWQAAGSDFDLVCCHGVVMYLPSLREAVEKLVAATRPGGRISVLSKNRANLTMRAAMSGDWDRALQSFDSVSYTNRLGVEDARSDDPESVIEALSDAGAETLAWYGVRLFTDHWGEVSPPADMGVIVRVEEEAGRRDPYRRLTSMSHIIAERRSH